MNVRDTGVFAETLIGVDTGGTFTDLVMMQGGSISTYKLPSTPDDPSRAVLQGVAHLLQGGSGTIFHGTTVATNALLEGKGADVAFLVTEGFCDLLTIGRQNRPDLYALHPKRRAPMVEPEHVFSVPERMEKGGEVLLPLGVEEIERLVEQVLGTPCRSVAICLLHSYVNPRHEALLAEALRRAGCQVSASHQVLAEFREFERASTTVINASVSPVMTRYLGHLKEGLLPSRLKVMQSNGGSISVETAGGEAVRTILSGPAGGMVGAFSLAKRAGIDRIMTFDMGGTSTDVGLCDGSIPMTTESTIADWPVKVPMIDIHTVGAGGGSIAWLDSTGGLQVGPQSAGADPGPVCYGKGKALTVTDANLCLQRLNGDRFLDGRMRLDRDRSLKMMEPLATQLGISVEHLAEGIIRIAEEKMAGALRVVSVQKGYDPRGFHLIPFGGAGGLHACSLAEHLGMRRILIPRHPGLLSAYGLVIADTIKDFSRSVLLPSTIRDEELSSLFAPLREQASLEMAQEADDPATIDLQFALDLRYVGQSFEISLPLQDGWRHAFHHEHERLYGYADPDRPVEIVTLRLRARAPGHQIPFSPPQPEGEVIVSLSLVWLDEGWQEIPGLRREDLPAGYRFSGPAMIQEATSTHLILRGWEGIVDPEGNLLLERRGGIQ